MWFAAADLLPNGRFCTVVMTPLTIVIEPIGTSLNSCQELPLYFFAFIGSVDVSSQMSLACGEVGVCGR